MKNNIILSLMFLMLVILSFSASATVGVTSFYYENNPLIVNPGDIKDIAFALQNHGGDADAVVKVSLADGEEIANFTDESLEYFVELESSDISIPLKITIPEDAQPGQEWNVGASFSITYKPRSGGAVQFSSTYFKDFKVIVNQPIQETTGNGIKDVFSGSPMLNLLYLIIILVILVLLIKLATRKK